MLQKPNTVLVGTAVVNTGVASSNGHVIAINAETGAGIDYSTAWPTGINAIQLGLKTASGIKKSAVITKGMVKNITADGQCAYSAKTESTVSFDWTGVTPVAGYRYVIRLIYKDLYEHPGQFTHTYEHIAKTGDTIDTIGTSLAAKINAHKGARCTATYTEATDVLLCTAKTMTANMTSMMGKEGITPYSQVQMTGVAYYTVPNSAFSSHSAIPGIVITVVASDPGKGNPYIVRDREQDALAYKGITYRTTWPIIKPELNVNLSSTYDTLVIESTNSYQSPDNQYVKETDVATEVYVAAGQGLEALRDAIAAWA